MNIRFANFSFIWAFCSSNTFFADIQTALNQLDRQGCTYGTGLDSDPDWFFFIGVMNLMKDQLELLIHQHSVADGLLLLIVNT